MAIKDLAIEVIKRALEDYFDGRRSGMGNRQDAIEFFRGGKGSVLEFWCSTAGIDHEVVKQKLQNDRSGVKKRFESTIEDYREDKRREKAMSM